MSVPELEAPPPDEPPCLAFSLLEVEAAEDETGLPIC